MISVTGDVHCPIDVHKLNSKSWPEQKSMTRDDYLVVCGDMGIVWSYPDGKFYNEDKYWQKWFDNRNYTTLFVDGNHENHDMLNSYPVEIWHGGKVHKIAENVIHLMRGQVYEINGIKVFTMGGASSHDMHRRTEGKDWWSSELPSNEEYEEAMRNLEKHNFEVDLIITHCAPDFIQRLMSAYYDKDKLTNFLDAFVLENVKFKLWCFGHYHEDKVISNKYYALYNDIINIDVKL